MQIEKKNFWLKPKHVRKSKQNYTRKNHIQKIYQSTINGLKKNKESIVAVSNKKRSLGGFSIKKRDMILRLIMFYSLKL